MAGCQNVALLAFVIVRPEMARKRVLVSWSIVLVEVINITIKSTLFHSTFCKGVIPYARKGTKACGGDTCFH